jgi:hypothetical protein
MSKMVAVKDRQFIKLSPAENCYYIPGGWIPSSKSYAFGDWSMKHPFTEPPKHKKPMVYASKLSLTTFANDCRIVPDNTMTEIDSIDAQIKQLQIKRADLLKNEFLTFPIVRESDLQPGTLHKRYTTKSEASKAKDVKGK